MTNPERYQVDLSAKALQVWAAESASIASLSNPIHPLPDAWEGPRSPRRRLFEQRSGGTEDGVCRAREDEDPRRESGRKGPARDLDSR
jgi:hypothetical protein